jgi:hypothetical protein
VTGIRIDILTGKASTQRLVRLKSIKSLILLINITIEVSE